MKFSKLADAGDIGRIINSVVKEHVPFRIRTAVFETQEGPLLRYRIVSGCDFLTVIIGDNTVTCTLHTEPHQRVVLEMSDNDLLRKLSNLFHNASKAYSWGSSGNERWGCAQQSNTT